MAAASAGSPLVVARDSSAVDVRVESIPAREVFAALGSARGGLTATEAASRLAASGPNELRPPKRASLLSRLAANFTHVMALLLWVGGMVAFMAGLPELGVAVWLVNVINGLFSFWQEFKAERATAALQQLLPVQATVLRDGRERRVDAADLVPGDVMVLSEGDRVSADARVVEDIELRVNQSTLTGESDPIRKQAEVVVERAANRAALRNMVFAGTSVTTGRGKAVVVATGMHTEFGRIAELTEAQSADPSPLQKELSQLSYVVSVIAVSIGVLFFLIALLLGNMDVSRGFVFALGMIVAFVPEGLLPTVTLSLAMGTQRMAKRNALVKRLSAVETLGSTTVICTDKTGTLTRGEMMVQRAWVAGLEYELLGRGYEPEGSVRRIGAGEVDEAAPGAESALRKLLVCAGLACDARLVAPGGDVPSWSVLGDPTEGAIEVACRRAGIDLGDEERRSPRIYELPFESTRRMMSTLHREGGRLVLNVKGAPTELLARCTGVLTEDGVGALDDALTAAVTGAIEDYGRRGLRVLGVATRSFDSSPADRRASTLEIELTFLGLVAMNDPPRPEVARAIATCKRAGIRVVMITGDYGLTAESIGRTIGLVEGSNVRIIDGDELEHMSDDALSEALDGEVLFSRAAPEHKRRIVAALQAKGHVVAVTGDGVNDAPALKKADIGVAMGVTGTDVAREAADMILLDDNFASIVGAVEEGRAVYANIKKFTGYILTSNTPEAVPFILFAFSGGRIPLALDVMHILSIDLGTDLVPALALGAELPEPGVMDQPPRSRDDHIVTRSLLTRSYLWLGPLQAFGVMTAFYLMYWTNGYSGRFLDLPTDTPLHHQAMGYALAAVVMTQIGNLFAQRTERISLAEVGFFTNKLVFIGIASELVVVAALVYAPFLQDVIGTRSFPLIDWAWLLPLIPLLLIVDEVRKALVRHRGHAERSNS